MPRELPEIPSFESFVIRDHHLDESNTRKRALKDNFGRLECISENDSKNVKAKDLPDNTNCADADSLKMSRDNCTQQNHSNETACLANTDTGVVYGRFTRAWVDTDTICIDGVKDPLAIERWQAQAMEADKEFYSRIRIPDEDDSSSQKQTCLSSASQGADSKPASERQSRGVEHIKQGLVNFIASLLMPLYRGKKIDREGYKSIMRKSVNKVLYHVDMFLKCLLIFGLTTRKLSLVVVVGSYFKSVHFPHNAACVALFSFSVISIILLRSIEHCCLVNLGDDNNNTDSSLCFLWPQQIIDTCSEGEKSMTTLEFLDAKRKIKVQQCSLTNVL